MIDRSGQVALVHEALAEGVRVVALVLASRGVRVVVIGADERGLGELVGEIVVGAGRARHVAGVGEAALARAWEKAAEAFGAPTFVVGAAADHVAEGFARARGLAWLPVSPDIHDVASAVKLLP